MSKNPLDALAGNLSNNLGEYLREQRQLAKLSVRQLSALAGVSNPYLSQIERGVKRPSADILQQIAKGLSISAETLYVQAGLLDPKDAAAEAGATTRAAIGTDPALTPKQRQTLLEIYESFAGAEAAAQSQEAVPGRPTPHARATRKAATRKPTTKKTSPEQAASPRSSASTKSAAKKSTPAKSTRKKTTTKKSTTTRTAKDAGRTSRSTS